MFYNATKRERDENSDELRTQSKSGRDERADEEESRREGVHTMDDKMCIGSNYDEYSRSIYASDNSYLRNHQQEKCSTKKFMTFTQQTPALCANTRTLAKHIFLLLVLQMICNGLVKNVICDESSGHVDANGHYTHTWVVHIPGGEDVAEKVASHHEMKLMGKIFDDHYHFEHSSMKTKSAKPSEHHQNRLDNDVRISWSKQQRVKSRKKRDFMRYEQSRTFSVSSLLNDPKWPSLWYLNRGNGLDMNVIPAWREGITGKGVVVTILDDGLETDHPDLERNYDPGASFDVNGGDADPMPHYDLTDSNRHGTRCAGEVAASANNSICSVGIAYDAKIGGVRMLDGDVTDAIEARSLGLRPQHIDIYSASWGPDDDGKTVDGPGEMATRAFIDGVTKGRGGKGSIFIWASGNGGREQDNCNCDGYANSIWTLSISSATEFGDIPWYSEKCASTLATTYSSGQQNEKQVVTTDLHHTCTSSHTGTSASAPLAAGIAALALEANPNLTWRDLQHIVIRTANPAHLGKSPNEFALNGVGRKVSHSFGYGLMDAAAMVRLARVWETVPEQHRCEIHSPNLDKPIPPRRNVTFTLKVDHCKGVNFLEHVQARISLTTHRRGDIMIFIKSPSGTRTCLLTERVHDVSRAGFNDWPFMSVHQWGESPQGVWELEIHNKGKYMGQIRQWNLVFHGTEDPPQKTDPPRQGKKKTVNNVVQNSVENSQWGFNAQDPSDGDAHLGERTADEKITRNSSCSRYSNFDKGLCVECSQQYYLYSGMCLDRCPERFYNEQKSTIEDRLKRESESALMAHSNICKPCSLDCLECSGPLPGNCLLCALESRVGTDDSHVKCTVLLKSSGDHSFKAENVLTFMLKTFIVTLMIIVLLIVIYLLHQKFIFNKNLQHKRAECEYSSLSQEQEELLIAEAAERNLKNETCNV